jgi:hypothetical protein
MASIWKKKQSEEKQSKKKKQAEYCGDNQSSVQCASGDHCKMNKSIEPHHTFLNVKTVMGGCVPPCVWFCWRRVFSYAMLAEV